MRIRDLLSMIVLGAAAAQCGPAASAQTARLEKISPHCHLLPGGPGSPNVAAVVTEGGILLVNPPGEEAHAVLEALRRISPRPVRWIVHTDLARRLSGDAEAYREQVALVLTSAAADKAAKTLAPHSSGPLRLVFERQLRLFPENLEIRIFSPEKQWHQGGDIAVYVPAEKVLMLGDIYKAGSFPDLEGETADASALSWIEALKQVADAIPLLKSAMPQPKPEAEKAGEEPKKPEEQVLVVPAFGPSSHLLEVKDLVATAQKLRAEVARAVAQRRAREALLDLPAFSPYRNMPNAGSFAARMYDELRRR